MAAFARDEALDEASLVSAARLGCVSSFEGLYRLHSGRVYALCLRLTADAGLAEELTQETFVRAWRGLKSFRGESAFGSWLFRVATNAVGNRYRAELRRAAREKSAPAPCVERSDPALRMDLETAIAALPPGARAVFVLHDVEGYGHAEIAAQLGIAAGTSKAQLHHARRLLRETVQL